MRAKISNRELLSHAVFPPLSDADKTALRATAAQVLTGPDGERPNSMSFGEQVVEALGEYVDAKLDYAESRRGPAAEYANPDHVDKAATRLQGLLDKVKFAL